ncbi:MAG: DUF167 domain-containing protein [Treponema sp.]|jgi:uncharacterized protein (TIGR00251 family)|nr:DUF167 domain-containing protein [Treponema sp.]
MSEPYRDCCRIVGSEIHAAIKALPGASKTEFAGTETGRLRVRLAAAPEDGKANAELIAFFAKTLGCPKRDIVVLRGEKSRLKTIALPLACGPGLEEIIGM